MTDNYQKIVSENLHRLYAGSVSELEKYLPARREGDRFHFRAFGEACVITPDEILLGDRPCPPIQGIVISLYALYANSHKALITPFKSFKEIPNSMPYVGAFKTHTEDVLIPHVDRLMSRRDDIVRFFDGETSAGGSEGDFSFVLRPLPKISLRYIFYEADEEFPASVTCHYSKNAEWFLPVDGLADLGEYTSKNIIHRLSE
jgi:hypothetical protein